MESAKWQFDFTAFLSKASATEHIAGEVKKSVKELDLMLRVYSRRAKKAG